ncbi:hypothetical protein EDB92DRAFT_1815549 [Lactarius akahatsu]|uniref:Uncharacterized protein n=1 Tax=Lactarius akahatsu TaxID=416441 RepID=A0AAD4QEI2_9AGAM|nr:hypothetical protein EDB92DRAFT_1815549 [Lactarius akahatsu]
MAPSSNSTIEERYPALKAQRPSLGRRPLLLLIADEFWSLDARTWTALASIVADNPPGPQPPWAHDRDEHDVGEDSAAAPGVVVRTDYSTGSDEAWAAFCAALRDAEHEFFADQAPVGGNSGPDDGNGDIEMVAGPQPPATESSAADSDDDASTDEEDEGESSLFAPLSDAARFDNISNLRALRLLFDVSARATPGSGQQHPADRGGGIQHRLSGLHGLQETYDTRGRTLWIFDARSRADGCARLVSEAGDVATGDSWRARATHMAELQAGLAARALRIDFGGLDRWDYNERRRNMLEADAGHAAVWS